MLNFLNPFSESFILKGVLEALQVINPLSESFIFRDFFKNIGDMLSYINPFSENFFGWKIIELLGDLLKALFVPSEEKILALRNVFTDKLSFIDSIKLAVNSIKNMYENVSALPSYSININSRFYSGELTIIDLAWYAPYKSYGDLVITGFTYILFIWRLWCRLPSILHGLGSSGEFKNDTDNHSAWYIKNQESMFK